MNSYDSTVVSRFLSNKERPYPSLMASLPLVIEPALNHCTAQANAKMLNHFLATHSKALLDDVATYGAVLLRNFDINSTHQFQKAILSITGMVGMSDLFMSEPGRVRVDNLPFVFHTNSRIKTGGTLHLGGFHNENYFSTDVPHYIAFCCLKPAKMGGETGLIHMGKVYEQLDPNVKMALEQQTFLVAKWPLSIIADRYQLSADAVKKACLDFGLAIENNQLVTMYKPSVLHHPTTHEKIVQANLCAELPELNEILLKQFCHHYKGYRWWGHQLAWRLLGYQKLRRLSLMMPELLRHPVQFMRQRRIIQKRMQQYQNNKHLRISSVFGASDIEQLAGLMHASQSSFHWQSGDILLVDNLQIAHAGMPGKTSKRYPRNIRAMLCNPIRMNFHQNASGLQVIDGSQSATLGHILQNLSLSTRSIKKEELAEA